MNQELLQIFRAIKMHEEDSIIDIILTYSNHGLTVFAAPGESISEYITVFHCVYAITDLIQNSLKSFVTHKIALSCFLDKLLHSYYILEIFKH